MDPNSAKYKLGKIAADAYVDAMEAKKRGEKVAWVSSNFPVEIPETMGIATRLSREPGGRNCRPRRRYPHVRGG